ncbi:MAG: zinc-binding dehydrogenase, partial [Deltaproteobacteria bacterium]|nr:zinc-binding dehydrogenase [Deltaproteobacteria bacterium]
DLIEAEKHQTEILQDCANLIDAGKLKILVHKTFPLEKAADAQQELEIGHPVGKIVLIVKK